MEEETYRDKIATVDKYGKRVWIYPKKPKGRYYNYRGWVSTFLLTCLFVGPWIKINGEPLLLLNVIDRKFSIFGQVFWPQDFYLLVIAMITAVVFIILFTVIYGRIFCGWICPQTIFMEMVFRKIEYWIEGDYKHQMKLNKAPWNADKIIKKGSKHFLFYLISFIIANTFLAYIIGGENLLAIIFDKPSAHIGGLIAILIFSFVFYFVFSKLREQVCTTICPYGRLQGVLLDKKSIVISYDHQRGENRAKFKKNEDRSAADKGDCIDCHQCVDVCPTGIDIRNGTQLECVNCTACIDACDTMMDGVGLKRGLIRYASEDEINTGVKFEWTARTLAYSAVLLGLLFVFTSLIVMRTDLDTNILRVPGTIFQEQGENRYSNLYNYKIINKSNSHKSLRIVVNNKDAHVEVIGGSLEAAPNQTIEGVLMVYLNRDQLEGMSTRLELGVYEGDVMKQMVQTKFLGPNKK